MSGREGVAMAKVGIYAVDSPFCPLGRSSKSFNGLEEK